jgi:hypothetical protein
MRIYIAAAFGQRVEVAEKARELEALGHEVTGRWFEDPPLEGNGICPETRDECVRRAAIDLKAIDACDTFVLLPGLSATGGKHVETGYALALARRKRVVRLEPAENVFHWLMTSMNTFATWKDFVRDLCDRVEFRRKERL